MNRPLSTVAMVLLSACSNGVITTPTPDAVTCGDIASQKADGYQFDAAFDPTCESWCRTYGQCHAGSGGKCIATSDADCIASENCYYDGLCDKVGDKCDALAKNGCGKVCASQGKCHGDSSGVCAVASDEDCTKSAACKEHGDCAMESPNRCGAPTDASCSASFWCEVYGKCHALGGQCLATTDSDCKQSWQCRDFGLCKVLIAASTHDCRAADEADCQAAKYCKGEGDCHLIGDLCLPKSDSDCAASDLCKTAGFCKFHLDSQTQARACACK